MAEGTTEPVESLLNGRQDVAASASKGKKKKKKATSDNEVVSSTGDAQVATTSRLPFSLQNLREAVDLVAHQLPSSTKSEEIAKKKNYEFWNTQPVPKFHEEIEVCGPIEPDKPISEVRAEPYSLPEGFAWDTLSLDDAAVLQEVYVLLNENYVEDDDNMFRFDYSPEFLVWALKPPGWRKDWHVGVRATKSGKLLGFISAVPASIRIYEHQQRMVEINFLCVHKKLRSKRVAPVLIREITRRVHMTGCFQAVYTAGVLLPKPLATCRYWHRSLNPKKLIDVKFSHLARNMTMQRTIRLYKLPETTKTPGFRPLTKEDVPKARKLLESYMAKFDFVPSFDDEEFAHWFVPRPGVIDCYVVEQEGGVLTDMVSYYTLPSTVMNHPTHKSIKAAYSFLNVSTKTKWTDLVNDGLISARNVGYDVFNALDLMENQEFLEPLKFGIGDGELHYYIYNWKCPSMPPQKVGLVLQ